MIFILKEDKFFHDSNVVEKGSKLECIIEDKNDGMIQVKFSDFNLERIFWVNKNEVELIKLKKESYGR
jgi:hypothetical protein